MSLEQTLRQRHELLAMTERLVAEYAGIVPAGSVMRTVARCQQLHLLRHPVCTDLTAAVEREARVRLEVAVPARRIA